MLRSASRVGGVRGSRLSGFGVEWDKRQDGLRGEGHNAGVMRQMGWYDASVLRGKKARHDMRFGGDAGEGVMVGGDATKEH